VVGQVAFRPGDKPRGTPLAHTRLHVDIRGCVVRIIGLSLSVLHCIAFCSKKKAHGRASVPGYLLLLSKRDTYTKPSQELPSAGPTPEHSALTFLHRRHPTVTGHSYSFFPERLLRFLVRGTLQIKSHTLGGPISSPLNSFLRCLVGRVGCAGYSFSETPSPSLSSLGA